MNFPFEYLNHAFGCVYIHTNNIFSNYIICRVFKGARIIVIGIIGPQNSGKSTLLNFMFGCVFTISDGRTTKVVYNVPMKLLTQVYQGVYGSLIQSPRADYDYLLLLDTEGIHSVEKSDPEYDRKVVSITKIYRYMKTHFLAIQVVLFTLAICDAVIINVKDEINESMRKTLDICASSLQKLQNNKMPKPVVFFVQNHKANVHNIFSFLYISILLCD